MKWVGRCGECQAWGTVDEASAPAAQRLARVGAGPVTAPAVPISSIQGKASTSQSSGVPELDRVLGGGIVAGAVLLLAGEPGVGKSTLLLEVAAQVARRGHRVLYVSGEESAAQVHMRAARTNALEPTLMLACETDLAAILSHLDTVRPDLVMVDSVQTISSSAVDGVAGGVTQVRAVTGALVQVAKERHLPTMLVGHVTKDGSIAGPRALEHVVDVVLHFEGERSSRLRVLRAIKNRFGPVDEIGCFDLSDDGIVEVADPTGLFVSRHPEPMSGTCVTVTVEGRRPMLAEVQALVSATMAPTPRRAFSGLDSARMAMILAVLDRRVGLRLGKLDVYASTVGGAVLRGPSSDLAAAVAIASAATDVPVPPTTIAIGEVGLAGELRQVPHLSQRLSEAARLGFTRAVVPRDHQRAPGTRRGSDDLQVVECADLYRALAALNVVGAGPVSLPPDLRLVDD